MLRVVPIDYFDDFINNLWDPSMDHASTMFRFLHPEIAQCRRRRRFNPLSPRMLLRNTFFQPIRHLANFIEDEDSDDSEPEALVYQVYVPSSGKKTKTGSLKKSAKNRKDLPDDKNTNNFLKSDATEATKDDNMIDRSEENASERLVAIARPLEPQRFSVRLDVSGYKPDNIVVKVRNRTVVIDAKYQETDPNTGVFIQRNLHRSYALPSHVNPDAVVSSLDTNGMLTVEAPQAKPPITESQEKSVEVAAAPADNHKPSSENEVQIAIADT